MRATGDRFYLEEVAGFLAKRSPIHLWQESFGTVRVALEPGGEDYF